MQVLNQFSVVGSFVPVQKVVNNQSECFKVTSRTSSKFLSIIISFVWEPTKILFLSSHRIALFIHHILKTFSILTNALHKIFHESQLYLKWREQYILWVYKWVICNVILPRKLLLRIRTFQTQQLFLVRISRSQMDSKISYNPAACRIREAKASSFNMTHSCALHVRIDGKCFTLWRKIGFRLNFKE